MKNIVAELGVADHTHAAMLTERQGIIEL